MYGILYQTMSDVYFDDNDLEVSTSIHIKETIQESDAHQVFNASLKSDLLDVEGLHTAYTY